MKDTVTFEKEECTKIFIYKEKPVIHISNLLFETKDKEWVNRLFPSSIQIKIEKLDLNNKSVGYFEDPLSIGQFISSDHVEASLVINRTFRFPIQTHLDHNPIVAWKLSITLRDIELQDDEKIKVKIMDKEYIKERVVDWEKRILKLYSEVRSWVSMDSNYSFREGNPIIMHEGLMKQFEVAPKSIPTLDLLYNGTLKLSFKPKGLWIMGANGRIDILSLKIGGGLLIDKAESLQPPKWYFVNNSEKISQQVWSKDLFLNLINP